MKKALLLISGGFDSPVAGYLAKKKGYSLVYLTFSQEPVTDEQEALKAFNLAKLIGGGKFFKAKIGKQLAELVNKCEHKFYYVLQRRLFLRIAEIVAKQEGCEVLITGDNLGQVGSQTLSNLSVIDAVTGLTVIRPLLTNDKVDTLAIAREIGTYDASCGPELCSLLGPKHPATSSTPNLLMREEGKIDVDEMVKSVLETLEELK